VEQVKKLALSGASKPRAAISIFPSEQQLINKGTNDMKEEHNDTLTPDERSELNALLDGPILKLTSKQWRERRHKLPKRHEQQKWNLLEAYMLSPTQELASQLGFDEIDRALFRLHELEKKENPMLFAAFHDSTTSR
jgi:hypothetical protein